MMTVCFCPHTRDPSIASYRMRCLLITQELRKKGYKVKISNEPCKANVLVLSKRYDQKIVEKALDLKAKYGVKIVIDICDNHFFSSHISESLRQRSKNLRFAIESADRVIVSSNYLAGVVKQESILREDPIVIGDVIENPYFPSWTGKLKCPLDQIRLKKLEAILTKRHPQKLKRVIWFGNSGSDYAKGGMEDVASIRSTLEAMSKKYGISLTVVSNSRKRFQEVFDGWSVPVYYIPWSKNTISKILTIHGISIIPARKNPFTMAKSENRVTTSLAHGLNVVADSLPSYQEFSDVIGLDDWNDELEKALNQVRNGKANPKLSGIDLNGWNERIFAKWAYFLRLK